MNVPPNFRADVELAILGSFLVSVLIIVAYFIGEGLK